MLQTNDIATAHRFTLVEYNQMSLHGIFEGRRTELIGGEILDMPSQRDDHAYGVTQVYRELDKAFDSSRFWVRPQMTLQIAGHSPEPDVAVVEGAAKPGKSYQTSAILVVEVSDSTLLFDTNDKASLYAEGGVPEYWVVSIPDRELIVHRSPTRSASARFGWKYAQVFTVKPGGRIASDAAPSHLVDPAMFVA